MSQPRFTINGKSADPDKSFHKPVFVLIKDIHRKAPMAHSGPDKFQREIKKSLIKEMVQQGWKKDLFNYPLLCKVRTADGTITKKYIILDGQHTIHFADVHMKMNGLPVMDAGIKNEAEAADLFYLKNSLRKMVIGTDKFHSRVCAGRSPEVLIAQVLSQHAVSYKPKGKRFNKIGGVSVIGRIYAVDPVVLDAAIYVLTYAFHKNEPFNHARYCNPMVMGIANALFLKDKTGKYLIDAKTMVAAILKKDMSCQLVLSIARSMRKKKDGRDIGEGQDGYGPGSERIMHTFIDLYNEYVSESKRIHEIPYLTISGKSSYKPA